MSGIGPAMGAMITVRTNPNPSRTRLGTPRLPNTGAVETSARILAIGKAKEARRAVSWAEVTQRHQVSEMKGSYGGEEVTHHGSEDIPNEIATRDAEIAEVVPTLRGLPGN